MQPAVDRATAQGISVAGYAVAAWLFYQVKGMLCRVNHTFMCMCVCVMQGPLFYPNIYIAGLHFNLRLALSSTNTFPPLLTTQRVPESRLPTRMERLRAHPPTILISSPHFLECYTHTDLFHRLRYSALRHQKLWCCDSRV